MENLKEFKSKIREEKMPKSDRVILAERIYDELISSCAEENIEKNIEGTGRIYRVDKVGEIKSFLSDYHAVSTAWNLANGKNTRADYKTLALGSDSHGEYIRFAVFGCTDTKKEKEGQDPEDITEWMLHL